MKKKMSAQPAKLPSRWNKKARHSVQYGTGAGSCHVWAPARYIQLAHRHTRFLPCSRSHLPRLLAFLPCCLAYEIEEAVVARRKWLPATRSVVLGPLRSDPRPVPWDPTALPRPRAPPPPRPSPSIAVSPPLCNSLFVFCDQRSGPLGLGGLGFRCLTISGWIAADFRPL
jgi:hypothetical protein